MGRALVIGGSVCYDVTSISSYARAMTDIERGYNRDGDDLCQFNLGIFCDEATKTPLYYSRYNGSITDKTNLPYVLAGARELGIRRVKMMVDGGFWDEKALKSLHRYADAFTIGMPAFLKESGGILAAHGGGIETYANELAYPNIYCVAVDAEVSGIAGRVLLFYDALSHLSLCNDISERVNSLKLELAALKRYPKSKLERYSPYFKITKHSHGTGFDYAVDTDKIEHLRRGKGFFLLFSTDMASSPSDILYYYRAKDADEKLFAQIKGDMDSARMRTHCEETTDGKVFVTFIACLIRSHILNKLSDFIRNDSTSLKKVFNQLANITVVANNGSLRFTKALSKIQKQILSTFAALDDIFLSISPF